MGISVVFDDFLVDDLSAMSDKLSLIAKMSIPCFVTHKPDIRMMKDIAQAYMRYENIIIIGNGGSISSSWAFYESMRHKISKNVHFIHTPEPDYINQVKKICNKEKSIVIPISKSGTTVGVIEALLSFLGDGYKAVAITEDKPSPLYKIAKDFGMEIVPHPKDIGGRYSGRSACALFPAILMGLDINRINDGAIAMYEACSPKKKIMKNTALQLSATLKALEDRGYVEIFSPVYSSRLSGFIMLVTQLIHESVCKSQTGQTYFSVVAPESQHHSNQRFFGGRKNMAGLFIIAAQDDDKSSLSVPEKIKSVKIQDGTLADLDNIPYAKALEFELSGTYEDAKQNNIPCGLIRTTTVDEYLVGEYMAFWHYVAVYLAMLSGQDPFDQPQVESSKLISWELRKGYHG